MNHEEMERAIEFLLEHDSRFNEAISKVKKSIDRLTSLRGINSRNTHGLSGNQAKITKEQLREKFNKLSLANEVTRALSEDVARLAVATSQRVTTIENKLEQFDHKELKNKHD